MAKLDIVATLSKSKGDKVAGTVFIRDYALKTTAAGKSFASGFFADQGNIVAFKVWSENLDDFKKYAEQKIVNINATVDTWNNTVSLIVDSVAEDICGYTPADFLLGHNRAKLETYFDNFVNKEFSPNAKSLTTLIISGDVRDRFFSEFAAKGKHDACPSGLANHTIKMMRLAKTMMENDSRIKPYADLIYVGVVLHDIGKIKELNMGSYQKNSFVSHREFGCEMLYEHKQEIISLYDEDFFWRLISIIRGHHHVYEENAKTIYAYIVHLIDMVDSQCTRLMDALVFNQYNESDTGEKTVGHHDELFYY